MTRRLTPPIPRRTAPWLAITGAALLLPLSARAQSDTTDARAHSTAGLYDAGVAAKGLELVGHQHKADVFQPNNPGGLTFANSDLAFGGHYVYQGNFSGLAVWDIADPTHSVARRGPAVLHRAGRRLAQRPPPVRIRGESGQPAGLRVADGDGQREQRANARHPHLRRLRSSPSEAGGRCADLSRLAHEYVGP